MSEHHLSAVRAALDQLHAAHRAAPPTGNGEPTEELAPSVGAVLLAALRVLPPAERLAYVLHDLLGVPFDRIAPILHRDPEAVRQLAARARDLLRAPGTPPLP
jgi:RNA polymerase sigma-70 factor, ECF subfamily